MGQAPSPAAEAGDAFDLAKALAVCQAIAESLERWQARMHAHQALCPGNILFGADGSVELRKDVPAPLAYISPEQTGRMNRGVDYRSDFYSMGVVFYQLLTGQLPFAGGTAMEIIHAHIARQAPPPSRRNSQVPPAIGGIVMKLLAKNAEDRYQSIAGVLADLRLCRTALAHGGTIADFAAGAEDACDRLRMPQKLYGREAERAQLRQAFARSAFGAAETAAG